MATDGQFYWPTVGTFVAAYGQFFMAANSPSGKNLGLLPHDLDKRELHIGCDTPPD
jgi:hypothetical protein